MYVYGSMCTMCACVCVCVCVCVPVCMGMCVFCIEYILQSQPFVWVCIFSGLCQILYGKKMLFFFINYILFRVRVKLIHEAHICYSFFHTHLNSSKNLCNNGVQVFLSLWGQLVHNVGKSRQTQSQVSANMLDFLFDLLLRLQGIKGQVVVSFKFCVCVCACVCVCGCGWGKWNSMW